MHWQHFLQVAYTQNPNRILSWDDFRAAHHVDHKLRLVPQNVARLNAQVQPPPLLRRSAASLSLVPHYAKPVPHPRPRPCPTRAPARSPVQPTPARARPLRCLPRLTHTHTPPPIPVQILSTVDARMAWKQRAVTFMNYFPRDELHALYKQIFAKVGGGGRGD